MRVSDSIRKKLLAQSARIRTHARQAFELVLDARARLEGFLRKGLTPILHDMDVESALVRCSQLEAELEKALIAAHRIDGDPSCAGFDCESGWSKARLQFGQRLLEEIHRLCGSLKTRRAARTLRHLLAMQKLFLGHELPVFRVDALLAVEAGLALDDEWACYDGLVAAFAQFLKALRELLDSNLPAGTANWVTSEFVERTLDAWQPHYTRTMKLLGVGDALEILGSWTNLVEAVQGASRE